jgi:phenylpyruvate tautomerase
MPHFSIETNIPKNKVTAYFLKQTTALMAKTLGKPESYCVAAVISDQLMVWGESTDPY